MNNKIGPIKNKSKSSSNGFSLIEILVSIGIMSIISLAIMTMMTDSRKESSNLQKKMDTLNLQGLLILRLNDSSLCTYFLSNPAYDPTNPKSFNAALVLPTTPVNISLNKIPSSVTSISTTGPFLVESNISQPPWISNIQLSVFQNLSANQAQAQFQVQLDPDKYGRALKPIVIDTIINTDGGSPAKILSCGGSVSSNYKKGFCTPPVAWDNTNVLTCSAISGFTTLRLTGVQSSIVYRNSGCCYIPNSQGSPGWCSGVYQAWNSSFSGCGAGNAFFDVTEVGGVVGGASDSHQCCFIPKNAPQGASDSFSSVAHAADNAIYGCGGPFANYNVIFQNVFTAGRGRNISCTYYSK